MDAHREVLERVYATESEISSLELAQSSAVEAELYERAADLDAHILGTKTHPRTHARLGIHISDCACLLHRMPQ